MRPEELVYMASAPSRTTCPTQGEGWEGCSLSVSEEDGSVVYELDCKKEATPDKMRLRTNTQKNDGCVLASS
eukprot:1154135-Amphidinium_carterae.1